MTFLQRLLQLGATVLTADNGQQALDLLNGADQLPDLVMLDIEMPVLDGIETLKAIRRSRRLRELPVIIATSRSGNHYREMAEAAGCQDYLPKNLDPLRLKAVLEPYRRDR